MAYISVVDSMGLCSSKFLWWAPKYASFLQYGAYRPFKVVDFGTNQKGVCDFQSLTVTLVLSCTVSEIWRLIGWKLWIFPTPLSFKALARGEPFRISGWMFYPAEQGPWAIRRWRFRDPSLRRFHTMSACDEQTDGRTDGRTDRHPDRS